MHSAATTVDEYMNEVPADRRDALTRLRTLCQASLPSFDEEMENGKPVYKKDGDIKISFCSQAHHIAFYACEPAVITTYEAEFSDSEAGMVQFNKADDINFELVEKLLHDTGALNH